MVDLTEEQQRVVKHRGAPLRVIAGPGTGKTSCLTARIQDLIMTDGVAPSRIHATTFTRAAAGEVLRKLETLGVPSDRMPIVGTVHSKAVNLLRRHGSRISVEPQFHPFSETELSLLLKDVAVDLFPLGIKLSSKALHIYLQVYRGEKSGAGIPDWISTNAAYMRTYSEFSTAFENLQRFYNGIDWFRVVGLAIELLDLHADILTAEHEKIEHLLVDEYQDLNKKEQEFIQRLAGNPRGLSVFGDEDQSIYETQRYADPMGLVTFDRIVSGTETKMLTYCHRCPDQILRKADALIRNNKRRIADKPSLRAYDQSRKGVIATVRHKSKKAEVEWLARKIKEFNSKGCLFKYILVLFADGKIAQDYIAKLEQENIPLSVQLKIIGPFDSECFIKFWATLCLIANAKDNLAVRQCLDYWPGIGVETVKQLRQVAQQQNKSLFEAAAEVAANLGGYRQIKKRKSVQSFYSTMGRLLEIADYDRIVPAIVDLLDDCKEDRGIEIAAEYYAAQAGKEDALSFQEVLSNFEHEIESGKYEVSGELEDKVRIMTMHSAKGLEAPVVIIPALEDDLMPGEVQNVEERRRLFYVSVTRSMNILLMSWAYQRTGTEIHRAGGRMLNKQKSRFLVEMGE